MSSSSLRSAALHAIAHVDESGAETARLEEFEKFRRKAARNAGLPPPTITGLRNR